MRTEQVSGIRSPSTAELPIPTDRTIKIPEAKAPDTPEMEEPELNTGEVLSRHALEPEIGTRDPRTFEAVEASYEKAVSHIIDMGKSVLSKENPERLTEVRIRRLLDPFAGTLSELAKDRTYVHKEQGRQPPGNGYRFQRFLGDLTAWNERRHPHQWRLGEMEEEPGYKPITERLLSEMGESIRYQWRLEEMGRNNYLSATDLLLTRIRKKIGKASHHGSYQI